MAEEAMIFDDIFDNRDEFGSVFYVIEANQDAGFLAFFAGKIDIIMLWLD